VSTVAKTGLPIGETASHTTHGSTEPTPSKLCVPDQLGVAVSFTQSIHAHS